MRGKMLLATALLLAPALASVGLLVLLGGRVTHASPGQTFLVSVDSAGNQANGVSGYPAISADGRYVAFTSKARNLVPGDTNECGFGASGTCPDVFVHDRQTGETTRVSVDSSGNQGDDKSGDYGFLAISADGRYVAFGSEATNLVPGDSNGTWDVFVHDRQTGQTTRVSVDSAGGQANDQSTHCAISDDGRYVAFSSEATSLVPGDANGVVDVFLHDRQTGETARVSVDDAGNEGDGNSSRPALSGDGRYVAFESWASNLVAGDTNGATDIFVHDRQTGETARVSVDGAGNQASGACALADISADGRHVAFSSSASNLIPDDTNGRCDVFVHDRETGETTRVSVDSSGTQSNGLSEFPAISGDGRYVAFQSVASNLVPGDTNGDMDIFVHDGQTGSTTRMTVDSTGAQGNGRSTNAAISGDGRYVAFDSMASDLVPNDTNGRDDVFVHDRLLPFLTATPMPTLTPTATRTSTATSTPADTSTPGPTATPAPDSDGDGCSDPEEAILGFDPLDSYDFFDVPAPARPDEPPGGDPDECYGQGICAANGPKNQAIDIADVLAALFYAFAEPTGVCGDNPNPNGVDYDCDKGVDTDGDTLVDIPPDGVPDGEDYDRTPSEEPNPPWDAGHPNGVIDLGDVLAVTAQLWLECRGLPTPTPTGTATLTSTVTPTPTTTPTATPTPNPAAIDAAIQATIDLVGWYDEVVSVENHDWPDSCLGLPEWGELCLPAFVPGYRITIAAFPYTVVWRTDLYGGQVRLEDIY